MNFFNTVLIFNPEVFILCQNVCGRGEWEPKAKGRGFRYTSKNNNSVKPQ